MRGDELVVEAQLDLAVIVSPARMLRGASIAESARSLANGQCMTIAREPRGSAESASASSSSPSVITMTGYPDPAARSATARSRDE